jgi:hypothetical protein
MNWEALGAIGEALSALGLFFVLVQVRYARSEMQRSIALTRAEGLRSSMQVALEPRVLAAEIKADNLLGNPTLPFVTALVERGLTEEEAHILFFSWGIVWQGIEPIIRSIDEALPSDRIANDLNVRYFYQIRPISRLWYETTKGSLNPDSVRYVDSVLAQPAA